MAVRSKWTVRVHQLKTSLRVGLGGHESEPQPITVSLTISGLAQTHPDDLQDCVDYEPICRWIEQDWPRSPHTDLLETRFNELVHHIFSLDKRIMEVWIGLYKHPSDHNLDYVGLEREVTRRQYQEQLRQSHALDFID